MILLKDPRLDFLFKDIFVLHNLHYVHWNNKQYKNIRVYWQQNRVQDNKHLGSERCDLTNWESSGSDPGLGPTEDTFRFTELDCFPDLKASKFHWDRK